MLISNTCNNNNRKQKSPKLVDERNTKNTQMTTNL